MDPSRRLVAVNSRTDSVTSALAVAIAAPSIPKYGMRTIHSPIFTPKAAA